MGRGAPARPLSGAAAGPLPLAGRRVLVTRSADRSPGLVERLRARGAEVVELPLLAIQAPDDPRPFRDAVRALDGYDWLLLTSANAVRAMAEASGARLPKALHLASAGPATTEAIREHFPGTAITAQATSAFGGEGLARALALVDVSAARMLFPVSDRSPATLADVLRARGARVDVVVAYRTAVPGDAGSALRVALGQAVDVATFASPSAVDAFVAMGGGSSIPAIVIGPTTARAARDAGLTVAATAAAATGEGLADAVLAYFAETRKRP